MDSRKPMDDTQRLLWLAGRGPDDDPVIEGINGLVDDYWTLLTEEIAKRPEPIDWDAPATPSERLNTMRRLVDLAMEKEQHATQESN